VSTALSELAEHGDVIRRADGSWLLRGQPPDPSALEHKRAMGRKPAYDLLRRPGRFTRAGRLDGADVETDQLIAAMDRLRDALHADNGLATAGPALPRRPG
jgi:CRP/FNR family cyclic AMP-dependent transcriptional regulator